MGVARVALHKIISFQKILLFVSTSLHLWFRGFDMQRSTASIWRHTMVPLNKEVNTANQPSEALMPVDEQAQGR